MLKQGTNLNASLAARGVTRRQLIQFCSASLATLAMPDRYLSKAVAAVGAAKKPVLAWISTTPIDLRF